MNTTTIIPEDIKLAMRRGDEIKSQIKQLTDELKKIEKNIERYALSVPHEPLKMADRDGKQAVLCDGARILPVRFEADALVSFIDTGSPMDLRVREIITPLAHAALFRPVSGYERRTADGRRFRGLTRLSIDDEKTRLDLIDAIRSRDKDGIVKSRTVIAWDEMEKL